MAGFNKKLKVKPTYMKMKLMILLRLLRRRMKKKKLWVMRLTSQREGCLKKINNVRQRQEIETR
jgi:hypothetical protein